MEERREPPPAAVRRPPISGNLSPVQAAHGDYSSHTAACPRCSDIDRGRCDEGERLWRAWNTACDDAYRRLAEEAS